MTTAFREELMRKIQLQRKFLDELLLDMVAFREPEPALAPEPPRREPQQERLLRAKDVQDFLGIKPATF
jgi:hypothetical protein